MTRNYVLSAKPQGRASRFAGSCSSGLLVPFEETIPGTSLHRLFKPTTVRSRFRAPSIAPEPADNTCLEIVAVPPLQRNRHSPRSMLHKDGRTVVSLARTAGTCICRQSLLESSSTANPSRLRAEQLASGVVWNGQRRGVLSTARCANFAADSIGTLGLPTCGR